MVSNLTSHGVEKKNIILENIVGESSPENNNGMSVHHGKKTASSGMRVHYENKRNYGVSVHHEKKKTNSSGMRVHYGKPKENYGLRVHLGKEQWGESSP